MHKLFAPWLMASVLAVSIHAEEFHVATNGSDTSTGTQKSPFRTIQHAAEVAQPGDVVTVHAGVYRERVNPPRGGTSDAKRIVFQAAAGEKVTITGSEPMKGWVKLTNDTWVVTLPNAYFGKFNPYADRIHGDWCSNPAGYHSGAVYLNGDWLIEAARFGDVLKPAGKSPLWFATVDGVADVPEYLMNIASIQVGAIQIPAERISAKNGTQLAACAEGGRCVGFIRNGDWARYDGVDFGLDTESVGFRAAAQAGAGGAIELHLDNIDGELLGVCDVPSTGDWQKWQMFTAKIKPVSGMKNLCLVFKPAPSVETGGHNTLIYAQFSGVNPNDADVEINVRQTVFTPSQAGIDYLTVRGFELRAAASPWAPPTAAQIGIISAYWCKGWIIESNNICYSPCCGVALGKYGDEWDNRAESAEGYVGTLTRALTNGWNKATVGSHIVRDNTISHCEQTGIVGSLGCSFSTVMGNAIHDIHIRNLYGGAEMAGIKFHGAIDAVISGNHIYRCGSVAGIWLDWMGQGAQVTGNLLHDNSQDMFLEMQHGPMLVANNILLSKNRSFLLNGEGIAFVHNLVLGNIRIMLGDKRTTPFQAAHSTELGGMHPASKGDSGDYRFYNNLLISPCDLQVLDKTALPCFAAGNVFTKGTQPSKFDAEPLLRPDFDPAVKLKQKADGWYLTLTEDKTWRDKARCKPVTTELLGKAKVSICAYENADGSPLAITTDYFGRKRDGKNPFPGPFEKPGDGKRELKVWPAGLAGAQP
jgi:alpha-N-arabinofuranosidase